ncbi:MAG: ThiF family adenylyltransferase [Oscillospiraceae bacterium]
MPDQFSRTELLLGKEAMERLYNSRVAVFGIGGVGGYAAEALARSGIGTLDLIDNDKVCLTNLNRQIYALHSTMDKYKVDAAAERIHDICPDIKVNTHRCFFMPDTADGFDFTEYDYVIDAIDTVTGKLEIIKRAKAAGVPVISSMGAGNKLDPTAFRVADIFETKVCPLAKVMRYELKRLGIKDVKVVYSEEKPLCPSAESAGEDEAAAFRRSIPGSVAFVPSVVGLIIAGEVIKDISRCGKV